ncbi:MAG: acetoacetyl-CoA synthetase, partial [Actinomycetota bacterium]|nr:acetoacetyl-CoA synthetase [Actinomycetota bacterium]
GPVGLADRFAQVSPTVLVVADGYCYGGKRHPRLELLPQVLALLPSVTLVVVVPELATPAEVAEQLAGSSLGREVSVALWPRPDQTGPASAMVLRHYRDPGFVLYSSGTTGQPKCIVHSALGLLLKRWTEHVLHSDIRPGDPVFYFTTCGWMMWNWLVGALAVGATIVLYDGSPLHEDGHVLWDLAEAEQVTFFGASAKFFDACRKAGQRPALEHDLGSLRTVASTGSPLAVEDFAWLYREVAPQAHVASISGGTDICGCFVLGDPTAPVYAGEIQTPALGVDVDVVDSQGASLRDRPGERGELICRNTFPSMPLGFWGDVDGSRYRAAYFEANPGVWTHGDFAQWTNHGGIVISGRSDATLNAGGVRIGTAEIYRQVESFDEVVEALAVGQEYDDDTRIVLFVRLAEGATLDDDLRGRIRSRLRSHASPRHVPAVILAATDLPRTRSGKLAELAVADVVNARPVRNTHALANAECLAAFDGLPELAPRPNGDPLSPPQPQ